MVVKKEVSIAGVFFFIRDAHTVCVKEREKCEESKCRIYK